MEGEADLADGEGARLVAAEDVHAPEVLDGGQALDDDLLPRHAHGSGGEGHRHDHRQKLGGEPDGEGHREEKGFERIPPEERVDEKNEEDQHEDDFEDQHPERAGPALELGLGRRPGQARRHLAELGVATGADHHRLAEPTDYRCALHHHGRRLRDWNAWGHRRLGVFLPRERLAGERRLVEKQVPAREEPPVARHEIARGEAHDVARHHFASGNFARSAVADGRGPLTNLLAEASCRHLRVIGLGEVEDDGEEHHRRHDGRAHNLAEDRGDGAGAEQDEHERVHEIRRDLPEGLEAPRGRRFVGAEPLETAAGFLLAEPPRRAREVGEHVLRRPGPEGRRQGHPALVVCAQEDPAVPLARLAGHPATTHGVSVSPLNVDHRGREVPRPQG